MKDWIKLLRLAVQFGQLGFTLITPPVVMGLLGWWLQSRFGLGSWIMLLCLLVGLLTAGSSAVTFFRKVMAQMQSRSETGEPPEKPVVFYRHD